ncbi:MAG: hypothetical protein JOY71_02690 [Acetobacteraceae bacterium]|nr:hypothetical protein [Acetobacteraceae bacterium]MBV8521033.1 hypothetical protein [Acetobacteraceae bacterium]MBV8589688.1 hypothetical protein [Acetobacteraceae bacterium]
MNMMSRSGPIDPGSRDPLTPRCGLDGAGYRLFVRALADEIDGQLRPQARNDLLRAIGERVARLLPVPVVASLEALEIEMNDRLSELGWGSVRLELQEEDYSLLIRHEDPPRVGSPGDPPGTWLFPALEGMYQIWILSQPGGDESLKVRAELASTNELAILRCARDDEMAERLARRGG